MMLAMFATLASCGSTKQDAFIGAVSAEGSSVSAADNTSAETSTSVAADKSTAAAVSTESNNTAPAASGMSESYADESEAVSSTGADAVVTLTGPVAVSASASTGTSSASYSVAGSEANAGCEIEGGGYKLEVLSAGMDKDYYGSDVVIVKMKFTNNTSAEVSLGDVVGVTAEQNGKKLSDESVVFSGESFGGKAFNFRTPVSNGASIVCVSAFASSSTDDVDISVKLFTNTQARNVLASASCTLPITE